MTKQRQNRANEKGAQRGYNEMDDEEQRGGSKKQRATNHNSPDRTGQNKRNESAGKQGGQMGKQSRGN
jgi:hypothetical protein